jgi:hypothetical protein
MQYNDLGVNILCASAQPTLSVLVLGAAMHLSSIRGTTDTKDFNARRT